VGPYAEPTRSFAVQVWGHVPATIEIQRRGELWNVILRKDGTFESAAADQASLRFGPKGAAPVSLHAEGADWVAAFRAVDTGIRPGEVNACLTGRRQDAVPFEGCDLLKRPPR
jgi:hypothetical protein